MGAEFTPGPWRVERIDYDRYGLDASFEVMGGGEIVAQTIMREIKTESERLAVDEANCRLIAAAPEMFEALSLLRAALAEMDAELHAQNIGVIDLTLAKARGDQP